MAATLTPTDANALVRRLVADRGTPLRPAEVELIAAAVRYLADDADTASDEARATFCSAELRQLAHQLHRLAGLADTVQEGQGAFFGSPEPVGADLFPLHQLPARRTPGRSFRAIPCSSGWCLVIYATATGSGLLAQQLYPTTPELYRALVALGLSTTTALAVIEAAERAKP